MEPQGAARMETELNRFEVQASNGERFTIVEYQREALHKPKWNGIRWADIS